MLAAWVAAGLTLTGVAFAAPPAPAPASVPASISVAQVSKSDHLDLIARVAAELQPPVGLSDAPSATRFRPPLSPSGKFRLAVRNFSDPLNIAGTAADAGISDITSNTRSAFGTGWPGFGRRFGMSMADEGINEFFSTFLIPSLAHQDPHYHRDPDATTGRRIVHALSRVLIARSDSGTPMFNVAEVAGTTASSLVEIPFHFEREETPGGVAARIFVSIGSDAGWNLMNEFLPDVARRVNPRFIFLRRLAEHAAKQN